MNKHYFRDYRQVVYHEQLANGLTIHLIPKRGFSGYCGVLSVKIGALNSRDSIEKNGHWIELKRGIAHFLEHRIFDNPRGQIFDLFSNNGASSNAYTSYDRTLYFFTSSEKVFENTQLLLDFTQELHVDDNKVNGEKNIINEELKMYEDAPDYLLLKGILSNLYFEHEVKYDIGGNYQEVNETTASLLKLTHQAYYHPHNMSLTISGDFDVRLMLDFIRENQAKKEFEVFKSHRKIVKEPRKIVKVEDSMTFELSASKCCYGIKLKPLRVNASSTTRAKEGLTTDLFLQLLFSHSSHCYNQFVEEKIVTGEIDTLYEQGRGYAYVLIYADVYSKENFVTKIKENLLNFPIDNQKFLALKKQMIGHSLREAENPNNIALEFGASISEGINVFEEIKIIRDIELADLEEIRQKLLQANSSVYTLVRREPND